MINSEATDEGGIRITIDGKSAELPPAQASAFIASMLFQMSKQAEKLGNNTPNGGARVFPDSASVGRDNDGEPQLMLGFGKAVLAVTMPPGQMKGVAQIISRT